MPTQKELDVAERVWRSLDLKKLRALMDEEITAAALSDPDAQPLTDEELSGFRVVRGSEHFPPKPDAKLKAAG